MALTKATYSMINGAVGNALDYGAVSYPTRNAAIAGVDSSAAIQAALAENASVFIPGGYYRIDNTLVMYSNQKLFGENFSVTNLIACGTMGSGDRNIIESARVNVINDGGTDAQIVIEDLNIDGGGNGVPYANGIELGTRTPNPGNGVGFEMRRVRLNYCKNGLLIHGGTWSVMQDIYVTGYDQHSSGVGAQFDQFTNGVYWDTGLVSDFATCIQLTGGGCVFIQVGAGTAANDAYGPGWTNYWTQSIWSLVDAFSNYFLRCGSEYLTPREISEVTISSGAGSTTTSISNVFEQFYWSGINTSSKSRVRVGVSDATYNAVSRTVFRDCIFLGGVPISGTQKGDIWIDNAINTLIEWSVETNGYYDTNIANPLIAYTTGNAISTNTKLIPWSVTVNTIGASGQPAFQNSWAAYGDANFQAPAYYIDGLTNVVNLSGIAASGTATPGTVIFTLPAGFRPQKNEQFATNGNGAYAAIQVSSNGEVSILAGTNVALSLSGICFRATQ